jgi:predicted Zn-dependent peptidase
VSEGELRKAKNIRTTSQVRQLKTNDGKAQALGMFEIYFGAYQRLFAVLKSYEAVQRAEVVAAAQRYLTPDNRTVVTLVPQAAAPPAEAP